MINHTGVEKAWSLRERGQGGYAKIGKSRGKSSKNLPKNTFKPFKLKGGSGKVTKRKVGRGEHCNTLFMYGFTSIGTEFSNSYDENLAGEREEDSDGRDNGKGGNGLSKDGEHEVMTRGMEEIADIE